MKALPDLSDFLMMFFYVHYSFKLRERPLNRSKHDLNSELTFDTFLKFQLSAPFFFLFL